LEHVNGLLKDALGRGDHFMMALSLGMDFERPHVPGAGVGIAEGGDPDFETVRVRHTDGNDGDGKEIVM
jgi:hypothetical protein